MLIFGLWKSTVSFINFKTFRDYLVKCSVDSLGRVGWMGVPEDDCTPGPYMPGKPAHWACVLGISQFSEVNSRKHSFRHARSLIFWASHPLSFILWVLLLVVGVHLCLTVCFPLVRSCGRPWLDYPNIRAGADAQENLYGERRIT